MTESNTTRRHVQGPTLQAWIEKVAGHLLRGQKATSHEQSPTGPELDECEQSRRDPGDD